MEFSLSEDQRMLQDSIRSFLQDAAPLDTVRQAADGDVAVLTQMADGLAALGTNQLLIPEAQYGLALGVLDAALVQEALGGAVAPADYFCNALATIGIAAAGTQAEQDSWLGKLSTGEVRFGLALTEFVGAREDAGVDAGADGLSGKSLFVINAAVATHILVCDRDGNLHIVARDSPGLKRNALPSIDRTRDFSELLFEGVESVRLSANVAAGAAAERMMQVGYILLAADTLGAAQTMLDKAVDYAKERKQFNRTIGSFQAVKHLCAEMTARLEPCRALVWQAAYAFDQGEEESAVLACLAKAHLAETGTFVARTSTEVHGGMGFTDLVGLHYWFKRIGTNRQLLGSPELVRAKAARLQGWA
ncbi:MAG: acyl-CoA dehydrogenase family protein [Pseudomonadota bacterium]